MYKNGMAIAALDLERIIVKVLVTVSSTKVANRLTIKGVRICLTAYYDSK